MQATWDAQEYESDGKKWKRTLMASLPSDLRTLLHLWSEITRHEVVIYDSNSFFPQTVI
jgi:hypothetical protein